VCSATSTAIAHGGNRVTIDLSPMPSNRRTQNRGSHGPFAGCWSIAQTASAAIGGRSAPIDGRMIIRLSDLESHFCVSGVRYKACRSQAELSFRKGTEARKKPRPGGGSGQGLVQGQECTMVRCVIKLAADTQNLCTQPDALTSLLRQDYRS